MRDPTENLCGKCRRLFLTEEGRAVMMKHFETNLQILKRITKTVTKLD